MEDMLLETEALISGQSDLVRESGKVGESGCAGQASSLSQFLKEHKGQDVSLLDLRDINNWTDFFIIATVSSVTHMDGLERHIKEFCAEKKIDILGCSRKSADDEWRLIDLGSIIIHLMTSHIREFYDLERLWA